MWTDTHCHLEDERYADDLGGTDGVLERARANGVSRFVTVGCDAESSRRAIEIASRHDDVWATVGLHPHEASRGVAELDGLFDEPRVVAVGEAGLDFYYDHSPRDVQRRAFAEQIGIARDRDLPLIVHTRDAWDDTFDVFRSEGTPNRVVFHCFTGGPTEAERCLALGAFLSFSGVVTFKNATEVAEAARHCPLDRLLIETDSPYLAPVPHRGRKNQPAHVADVGRFVAELRGLDERVVAEVTSTNACIAFPGIAS